MRKAAVPLLAALLSCAEPSEPGVLGRTGTVEGPISTSVGGAAWVFLYRPGEGPPGAPAQPVAASAVSAERMTSDPRFVIAQVRPNAWRLWGLVDVDDDFDPTIDVLSQPTAGDRTSKGVDFQAQPGRGARVPLEIDQPVFTEPPAFSFEGELDQDVVLDPALDAITPLTLVADPVGRFDPRRVAFTFGLLDVDGDQRPDDSDGDGTPDLSLQLFLRWKPLPGQLDAASTVIVPLAFDPSPFLRTLENRLDTTVTATRLQVVMVPQAVRLGPAADGGPGQQPFGPPPAGDYELVALSAGGQFWRVPNQLGPSIPAQGARLHIDRLIR
ncbi:MAG: hypothetical protein ACOZQL_21895 [Myxococcota bacterium]